MEDFFELSLQIIIVSIKILLVSMEALDLSHNRRERIYNQLVTSDLKLKASRQGAERSSCLCPSLFALTYLVSPGLFFRSKVDESPKVDETRKPRMSI